MDFLLSLLPTTMHPTALRTNKGEKTVLGLLLPAMSHSCTRTFRPFIFTIFSTKSIPDLFYGVYCCEIAYY